MTDGIIQKVIKRNCDLEVYSKYGLESGLSKNAVIDLVTTIQQELIEEIKKEFDTPKVKTDFLKYYRELLIGDNE